MKQKKIENKKKSFLSLIKNQYTLSWKYIKESKNFIFFSIFIFVISAILGFFLPISQELSDKILFFLEDLINKALGMSFFEIIIFIFLNNLQSSFFAIFFGSFFGIFPVISSFINGYLLGFVSLMTINSKGVYNLLSLLPHGIFELPAVFISFGLGLKFGSFFLRKNPLASLKYFFINSIRVFIFIVTPLLIIAAIIEGSLIFLG